LILLLPEVVVVVDNVTESHDDGDDKDWNDDDNDDDDGADQDVSDKYRNSAPALKAAVSTCRS
jgi:hypothetical protein